MIFRAVFVNSDGCWNDIKNALSDVKDDYTYECEFSEAQDVIRDKFLSRGDSITIEFDTIAGTARVINKREASSVG